jgi:hypothetical protein
MVNNCHYRYGTLGDWIFCFACLGALKNILLMIAAIPVVVLASYWQEMGR